MYIRKKSSASFWKHLFLLYSVSLVLRLGFVLLVGRGDLSLDEIEYHMLAANLAEGNGYTWFFGLPSTFRPPGYPFLLSALYLITGPNYFAARIVQSMLAATLPGLTYLLGRQVFEEKTARLGGFLTALYPPLIVHCAALLTENIFIPLLILGIWLLILSKGGERIRLHLFASLIVAVAVLLRPSFTFFLPVICLWLLLKARNARRGYARIGVLLGIWILAVSPWCLRNYEVAGQFVYLDTRAGYNLFIGYRDGADGSFDIRAAQEPIDVFMASNIPKLQRGLKEELAEREVRRRLYDEVVSYKQTNFPNHIPAGTYDLSEVESDVLMHEWGMQRARAFVVAHPWKALKLIPLKFMSFWNLEHRLFIFAYSQNFLGPLPPPLLAGALSLLIAPFACLTLLGVFGAVGCKWDLDTKLLLIGIVVYYSLIVKCQDIVD